MNKLVLSVLGLPRWLAGRWPLLLRVTRKAALLPLLLPLLLYVGAQFYLHRTTLAVIENAIAELPDTVQFRFDQLDSDFDGVVDIRGATLLLPGMSLPLQFQTLQLMTSSWRELPAIVGALDQGLLPSEVRIKFTLAETELSRLATASLFPLDTVRLALGCSEPARLAAAPGVEAVFFAGRFDYRFDPQSEYLGAQLQLSAEQRFRVALSADLDIGAPKLQRASFDAIGLGGAALSFVNLGAQTALMRGCGALGGSGLVEGRYVARQSSLVKHQLLQQGWAVSPELELAYQDYLFLPRQLSLQLTAAEAMSWVELAHSAASWAQFAVRVGLNTPQADRQGLSWQPRAHAQAATVEKAVAERLAVELAAHEKVAQHPVVAALSRVETALPEPRSRSPISEVSLRQRLKPPRSYRPAYKPVSVVELSGLLGVPMRLSTRNGRLLEGVLDSVTPERLHLRREISQGVAIVPVRLDIISGMQAYF